MRGNNRSSPSNKDKDDGKYEWGKKEKKPTENPESDKAPKDKPNFGLSGKLTEETNMVNGVVIKYSEPPEGKQPKRRWRSLFYFVNRIIKFSMIFNKFFIRQILSVQRRQGFAYPLPSSAVVLLIGPRQDYC